MDIKQDKSMEETILETAESLFLEKGFERTSTTQIAKAAGCNQALVHYYFRTKDNLFNTIFEHKFKDFFKSVFRIENIEKMNFKEKLQYIIESHFDIISKNPKMPNLILTEFTRNPDQVKLLKTKLQDLPLQIILQMEKELEKEIEEGNIRSITLLDLIISIVSLNISLFLIFPVFENLLSWTEEQKKEILLLRKAENVKLIINSLRP